MSTWDIIAALMGAAVALDVGANVAVNPRIDDPTRLATADYFDTRSLVSGFPALSGDSAMVAIARTAGDGHTDPTLHLDLVNRATGRVARTSVVARPPRRIDGAIDSVIVAANARNAAQANRMLTQGRYRALIPVHDKWTLEALSQGRTVAGMAAPALDAIFALSAHKDRRGFTFEAFRAGDWSLRFAAPLLADPSPKCRPGPQTYLTGIWIDSAQRVLVTSYTHTYAHHYCVEPLESWLARPIHRRQSSDPAR